MAGFADYSTTAANNNASSPNGAPELMQASHVNDVIREFMARAKGNYADVDAYFVAGGTANAITGTPANVDSYVAGQTFRFKAANDNSAATTVNINSLGAKNLYLNGAALTGGEIVTGRVYGLTYDGTQFQLNDTSTAVSQGLHTLWVPAMAMYARTTSGAAIGSTETTTNKVMLKSFDFDASSIEYVQFTVRMPKSWNEGTFTAAFLWTAASGSGDVIWGIQGVAIGNDDAIDAAFGTAQTATDSLIAANDNHVSPTTSAATIAGTPAAEDWVVFQVYRNATAGGDTLGVDAQLLGVTIYVTINAANDA